jgi:hypothetical protein
VRSVCKALGFHSRVCLAPDGIAELTLHSRKGRLGVRPFAVSGLARPVLAQAQLCLPDYNRFLGPGYLALSPGSSLTALVDVPSSRVLTVERLGLGVRRQSGFKPVRCHRRWLHNIASSIALDDGRFDSYTYCRGG